MIRVLNKGIFSGYCWFYSSTEIDLDASGRSGRTFIFIKIRLIHIKVGRYGLTETGGEVIKKICMFLSTLSNEDCYKLMVIVNIIKYKKVWKNQICAFNYVLHLNCWASNCV